MRRVRLLPVHLRLGQVSLVSLYIHYGSDSHPVPCLFHVCSERRRLQDHFLGKQHIGYQYMRDTVEAIRQRREAKGYALVLRSALELYSYNCADRCGLTVCL